MGRFAVCPSAETCDRLLSTTSVLVPSFPEPLVKIEYGWGGEVKEPMLRQFLLVGPLVPSNLSRLSPHPYSIINMPCALEASVLLMFCLGLIATVRSIKTFLPFLPRSMSLWFHCFTVGSVSGQPTCTVDVASETYVYPETLVSRELHSAR